MSEEKTLKNEYGVELPEEQAKIENMSDEDRERLSQVDDRIESLIEHRSMWFRAGGMGGRMAMDANQEISDLRVLRGDIINGTNNYESLQERRKLQKEIRELRQLREDALFLKRYKLGKEIQEKEEKLRSL